MGRPAKTREQRLINGNAREKPLPKAALSQQSFDFTCPDWVSKGAKEFWETIVPTLKERKVVGQTDYPALVILCQSWAEFQDATKVLAREGRYYEGPNGAQCAHPAVRMQMNAMKAVNAFMEKFGLQPTTRARLPIQQAESKDGDNYSEFRGE